MIFSLELCKNNIRMLISWCKKFFSRRKKNLLIFDHFEPATQWRLHCFRRKLHFTTLNYALNYTLHSKLFECIVCTLNYDSCYTLHPIVSFIVKWDGDMKHVTCMCVFLKWYKLKRPKTPLSHQLKTIFFNLSLPKSKSLEP